MEYSLIFAIQTIVLTSEQSSSRAGSQWGDNISDRVFKFSCICVFTKYVFNLNIIVNLLKCFKNNISLKGRSEEIRMLFQILFHPIFRVHQGCRGVALVVAAEYFAF